MLKSPLTGNSDDAWRAYGRDDPYYGVLSDARFRRENLTEAALADFYHSGETFVTELLRIIRAHFDQASPPDRVLEFGCGVGRLTIPLSRMAREVVAVDISTHMMDEARNRCATAGVRNVLFVPSDDALASVPGRFQLAVSFIVFQHVPAPRTERIVKAIIDRLAPGGIAALHVNYAGSGSPLRRALHHLRKCVPFLNLVANVLEGKRLGEPMMQMNRTSMNRMCGWLQNAGCRDVVLHLTDHGGERGAIVCFRKPAE